MDGFLSKGTNVWQQRKSDLREKLDITRLPSLTEEEPVSIDHTIDTITNVGDIGEFPKKKEEEDEQEEEAKLVSSAVVDVDKTLQTEVESISKEKSDQNKKKSKTTLTETLDKINMLIRLKKQLLKLLNDREEMAILLEKMRKWFATNKEKALELFKKSLTNECLTYQQFCSAMMDLSSPFRVLELYAIVIELSLQKTGLISMQNIMKILPPTKGVTVCHICGLGMTTSVGTTIGNVRNSHFGSERNETAKSKFPMLWGNKINMPRRYFNEKTILGFDGAALKKMFMIARDRSKETASNLLFIKRQSTPIGIKSRTSGLGRHQEENMPRPASNVLFIKRQSTPIGIKSRTSGLGRHQEENMPRPASNLLFIKRQSTPIGIKSRTSGLGRHQEENMPRPASNLLFIKRQSTPIGIKSRTSGLGRHQEENMPRPAANKRLLDFARFGKGITNLTNINKFFTIKNHENENVKLNNKNTHEETILEETTGFKNPLKKAIPGIIASNTETCYMQTKIDDIGYMFQLENEEKANTNLVMQTIVIQRFVLVQLRCVIYDTIVSCHSHFSLLLSNETCVLYLVYCIRDMIDADSEKIYISPDRLRLRHTLLPHDWSLKDCGYHGYCKSHPQKVILYYDYDMPFKPGFIGSLDK